MVDEVFMDNKETTENKESPAIQYSRELKDDLNLTLSNLREKSLTTSSMKAKWIGYMAKEKEALAKLISFPDLLSISMKMCL